MTSPEDSYSLPCYIQPLADAFAPDPDSNASRVKSRKVSFGVHKFFDLEATEEISCSDSASSSEFSDWN